MPVIHVLIDLDKLPKETRDFLRSKAIKEGRTIAEIASEVLADVSKKFISESQKTKGSVK